MNETPISLYLQLEEGANADMEAVGRAAIAFSKAIKEAVFIYDPSWPVRVELVRGDEGSLDLKALLRSLKDKKVGDKTLIAIAAATALGFANTNWQYIYGKLMDRMLSLDEQTAKLDHEEREKLVTDVANAVSSTSVNGHICAVYREITKDQSITGVGVAIGDEKRPEMIVARGDFDKRIGVPPPDMLIRKREKTENERVLLLSPYLKQDDHKWRFCGRVGNFSATIKDTVFLERAISGRIVIPMVGGVELDVVLKTSEEWKDGVWVTTDRTILEVRQVHQPPVQGRLDLPSPDPSNHQGKNGGRKR